MLFIQEIIYLKKDGPYINSLDEYESIGTHWIDSFVNVENLTYFDSFGLEHIPKEIKKNMENKNILSNIHRIQAFLNNANFFSPNKHEKKKTK